VACLTILPSKEISFVIPHYHSVICFYLLQDWIGRLIRECNHELEKFPAIVSNMTELQRRKELKGQIEQHKEGKQTDSGDRIMCYLP
jgi:hypothetical protein